MRSCLSKLMSLVVLFAIVDRAFAGSDIGTGNVTGPQKAAQMYADHFNGGKGATGVAHFGPGPDPRKPFTIENYGAGLIPPDLWAVGPTVGSMFCRGGKYRSGSAALYCLPNGRKIVLGAFHVGKGICGRDNPAKLALDLEKNAPNPRSLHMEMVNASVGAFARTCLSDLDVAAYDVISHDIQNRPCLTLSPDGVDNAIPSSGAMIAIHNNIFDTSGSLTGDRNEHFQAGFNVHNSRNFDGVIEYSQGATGKGSSGTPVLVKNSVGQYVAAGISTNAFEGDKINVPVTEDQSSRTRKSGNFGPSSKEILACFGGS